MVTRLLPFKVFFITFNPYSFLIGVKLYNNPWLTTTYIMLLLCRTVPIFCHCYSSQHKVKNIYTHTFCSCICWLIGSIVKKYITIVYCPQLMLWCCCVVEWLSSTILARNYEKFLLVSAGSWVASNSIICWQLCHMWISILYPTTRRCKLLAYLYSQHFIPPGAHTLYSNITFTISFTIY